MSCSGVPARVSPGCFPAVGTRHGDTQPWCCVTLLPELCGSRLRSAPTSLAAIKQIKYLCLHHPLGRQGLPGSTGLGLVASPEALRPPGGLEDVAVVTSWGQAGGTGPPKRPCPRGTALAGGGTGDPDPAAVVSRSSEWEQPSRRRSGAGIGVGAAPAR